MKKTILLSAIALTITLTANAQALTPAGPLATNNNPHISPVTKPIPVKPLKVKVK